MCLMILTIEYTMRKIKPFKSYIKESEQKDYYTVSVPQFSDVSYISSMFTKVLPLTARLSKYADVQITITPFEITIDE